MPTVTTSRTRAARPAAAEPLEPRRLLAAAAPSALNLGVPVDTYPHITPVGDVAFFSSSNAATGTELWRSDGTPAGTWMVKDITPGPAGTLMFDFTASNGWLYFWANANDGTGRANLWKSDGTAAGTTVVRKFNYVDGMGDVDGTLYFNADDGRGAGIELWKTDGTDAGTEFIKDIGPGERNGFPIYFTEAGGYLYFGAQDPTHGFELWRTDGTPDGTVLVKDIKPGSADSGASPKLTIGDTLYTVTDEAMPQDLYRTDGPTGATTLVKRISDMTNGANAFFFVPLDDGTGRFVFSSPNKATGYELWRSDGTAAGTVMIKEINPGTADGILSTGQFRMAEAGGLAYFVGIDPTSGDELWSTDGSAAGTKRVVDINPGAGSSEPVDLRGVGDKLFFAADADGPAGAGKATLWAVAPQPTTGSAMIHLYEDVDGNALPDAGDPPLAGRTVWLDADGNGVFDAGEASRVSGADGTVLFDELPPGSYDFRQVLPVGWAQTAPVSNRPATITVIAGQVMTFPQGLGSRQTAGRGYVSGVVYLDDDGDGIRDAGEAGAFDRLVYLDADNDRNLDSGERFARTNANGSFSIEAVDPGSYVLRRVAEPGWFQTRPAASTDYPVFVSDGSFYNGGQFGIVQTGSVSGSLYNDANANGRRDAGEGPVVNQPVFVDYDNDGTLDANEPFARTLSDGTYRIENVLPGTRTVRQVLPTNFVQTDPVGTEPVGRPAGRVVSVAPTGLVSGVDFGSISSTAVGRIAGTVFDDVNGNGVRDAGERAFVPNRVVYIDADNDGALDPGERTFTTLVDGYWFDGLAPGTYTIRAVVPAGLVQTTPANNAGQTVTVVAGQRLYGYDFGLAVAGATTVSGLVYHDADADGTHDVDEAPLSNQVVYLDADDDGTLDAGELSARSDAAGHYTIAGVAPGTYAVRQVLIVGYVQTDPGGRDDAHPTPGRTVTVAEGRPATGVDFGSVHNSRLSSISGFVFNDANANGVQDAGEGSPGPVDVYIDADNDGTLDAGEPRPSTVGLNGYAFRNLPPGTYAIRVVVPSGFVQSFPAGGAAQVVTVGFSEGVTGKVFGLAPAPEPVTVTVPAAADAYVKDGTSADTNFGAASDLQVKKSTAAGLQRETYLRFDLAGVGPVRSARVRLYGALQSASGESIPLAIYPSSDLTWPEDAVTWNTRPAADAVALSTQTVSGTTARWYEWDVSDYLRAQKAAGAAAVTFALKGVSSSSAYVRFASVEGAADPGVRPQLVVDQDPADVTPPRVLGVLVSGSAWTPEFAASFAPRGLGDGGYLVPEPNGAAQRVAVPWTNLSKISFRFSEDARVNLDDLRITGLLGGELLPPTVLNYDPVTHTATWVLTSALPSDRYTIDVDGDVGGVTDAAGNRLLGAAGGTAAGDYVLGLNVLVGDATGDGAVNALDLAFIKARLNATPSAATFSPFADLNGDGRTNALDLATAKQRLNQRLPAPPAALTAAPPAMAAFSSQPTDGHDELATLLE